MSIKHFAVVVICLASPLYAETLTLPIDKRPTWLREDGIVMAGSWEPLLFRVRRDGSSGYAPTDDQRANYLREHSPEMVARLKELGVNFVMLHCYKGAGLKAERESMADAVEFAKLCRENGLRVGAYVYSGAFIWELFFQEVPAAKDWVTRDVKGEPILYNAGAPYRYRWNRNHPGAQAFYRRIVRFAAEDIQADLLHFDNYATGPGYEENSVRRFREHLQRAFTPEQRRAMGASDWRAVTPPTNDSNSLLRRVWDDFCCQSLADSYYDMNRFARSLRPDVLVECNPGGVGEWIRPPRDHGRLLQGGEAFWDESRKPSFRDGKLESRIRTYKIARCLDNIAFCYTTTPLEMAESMAFNRDCLGAVCWFEYGAIKSRPGSVDPISLELAPYIRFFHNRRELLRDAEVVADIAILRSFPSQGFGGPEQAQITANVEELLIKNRACFQIIYDHQLDRLRRYRTLVLAGCSALSNEQIEKIKAYVRAGGGICAIGPVATYDEWMRPREEPALEFPRGSRVVNISDEAENADLLAAIRRSCDDKFSLSVKGRPGLCTELTETIGRRLVHFVNYRTDVAARNVATSVRLPPGMTAKSVKLVNPQRVTDQDLPFEENDGSVEFVVPEVAIYEIAVVETE